MVRPFILALFTLAGCDAAVPLGLEFPSGNSGSDQPVDGSCSDRDRVDDLAGYTVRFHYALGSVEHAFGTGGSVTGTGLSGIMDGFASSYPSSHLVEVADDVFQTHWEVDTLEVRETVVMDLSNLTARLVTLDASLPVPFFMYEEASLEVFRPDGSPLSPCYTGVPTDDLTDLTLVLETDDGRVYEQTFLDPTAYPWEAHGIEGELLEGPGAPMTIHYHYDSVGAAADNVYMLGWGQGANFLSTELHEIAVVDLETMTGRIGTIDVDSASGFTFVDADLSFQ